MSNTVKAQTAEPATEEPKIRNATMPFHGRDIEVCPPNPDQLSAILSFCNEFEQLPDGSLPPSMKEVDDVLAAMSEALDTATCLFVRAADRRYVRKLVRERVVKLEETIGLMLAAVEQLRAANPQLEWGDAPAAPAALVTG